MKKLVTLIATLFVFCCPNAFAEKELSSVAKQVHYCGCEVEITQINLSKRSKFISAARAEGSFGPLDVSEYFCTGTSVEDDYATRTFNHSYNGDVYIFHTAPILGNCLIPNDTNLLMWENDLINALF